MYFNSFLNGIEYSLISLDVSNLAKLKMQPYFLGFQLVYLHLILFRGRKSLYNAGPMGSEINLFYISIHINSYIYKLNLTHFPISD